MSQVLSSSQTTPDYKTPAFDNVYNATKEDLEKIWQQTNKQDIYRIRQKARELLEQRNAALPEKAESGNERLTEEQINYALDGLCEAMTAEYLQQTPTQRQIDLARQNAFSSLDLKLRDKVQQNLNGFSIETLIAYVFSERIKALDEVIREEVRKKQLRNEQMEAIGELKTMLAGVQPDTGETQKKVTIAKSDKEIMALTVTAQKANFDLTPFIDNNEAGKFATKIVLPYASYNQLNTALTAHTDKYTNQDTNQQFLLTELYKRLNQCWEFMSTFSKRHHDTIQTIISNMR